MNARLKNSIRLLHLWAGLLSGVVIFIVCLTGSLYVFRAPIENGLNHQMVFVEPEESEFISLDTIRGRLEAKNFTINTLTVYGKPNRSHEISYTANDGSDAGTFYVNPYSGEILGKRSSVLSPFFEFVLAVHKNLLLSNLGKQVVGASVLIFIFMLLSGFILWLPRKAKELLMALKLRLRVVKLIDLHKVPGVYSLALLFIIAVMGLYISYPWVKSALIISFGGNPVLSNASEEQETKIREELANSFSDLLRKQLANKLTENELGEQASLDQVLLTANNELPYQGIVTVSLPTPENSWIKVRKMNRQNFLKAIVYDELEFSKSGTLTSKYLFVEKSTDQKFIALSLPLHTGEILGWPSLVLYFLVSLVGASLPVTGTILWYKRKRAQLKFKKYSGAGTDYKMNLSEISSDEFLIAYATRTGNAKIIATTLQEQFKRFGLKVKNQNISTLIPKNLNEIKYLFVVISTDGNGVPPLSAKGFFKELEGSVGNLHHLNYSVCALGDSAYELFCQAGKDLDSLLKNKFANEIVPRMDCDTDFPAKSISWITETIQAVFKEEGIDHKDNGEPTIQIQEKAFKELRVEQVTKISKGDVEKPCFHIVLYSNDRLDDIKPGDSIEIIPRNPEWLVNDLINALKLPDRKEIKSWLEGEAEITSVTKATIEKYNKTACNTQLEQLLDNEKLLRKYLAKANFYDVIVDYPTPLNEAQLRRILPVLKGRLYSVASSSGKYPYQIHLTVKSIRYIFQSRIHEGAGSIALTNSLLRNDLVKYRHYPNDGFRLPVDENAPLVFIGVGTGIAPFRAFLQESEHKKQSRKIWMIWGDKKRDADFLYEHELTDFQKKQVLNRLDVTFSRDGHEKKYVHNIMHEYNLEIINWANSGAHFFVCGSLPMAADVSKTLTQILDEKPDSKFSFNDLLQQERYHEDAY